MGGWGRLTVEFVEDTALLHPGFDLRVGRFKRICKNIGGPRQTLYNALLKSVRLKGTTDTAVYSEHNTTHRSLEITLLRWSLIVKKDFFVFRHFWSDSTC